MKTECYSNTLPLDTPLSARTYRGVTLFCRAISSLFNPLFIPVFGIALLLYGDTVLRLLPCTLKAWYLGSGVLSMAVVPGLSIMLMRNFGMVSDLSLPERRERFLPTSLLLLCYIAFFLMIRDVSSAFLIRKYLLMAIGCATLMLGVTFFWKISAHAISAGGFSALLTLITISGVGNLLPALIVAILVSGALCSARLWLGHHTPAQVATGYLGGFGAGMGIMLIF